MRALREAALSVACHNIGYGESGRNNDGKFIEAMGGIPGEEWCALFAGYCYRRACRHLELPLDTVDWCYRRVMRIETSAKRLVRQMGASVWGIRYTDTALVLPGDLIAWHRGKLGWQGHVGIVEDVRDGIVHTIEGNVGAFPARVRRLRHDVSKERFYTFAGLR